MRFSSFLLMIVGRLKTVNSSPPPRKKKFLESLTKNIYSFIINSDQQILSLVVQRDN